MTARMESTVKPAAHINMLPDLSLHQVFVHLDPYDLSSVSQVCSRWRELSGWRTRRLWSNKRLVYDQRSTADCHRAVAVLSRSHGVHPFSCLEVKMDAESRVGRRKVISFGAGAEKLTVQTSSSLMLLLCLRHLLPQRVTTLRLTVSCIDALTPFEALVVWETIASKEFVVDLSLTLHRSDALFLCPFKWPRRGFLTHLRFKAVGNSVKGTYALCAPVKDLIEVHRHQLLTLRVLNADQQSLLGLAPHLYHVEAVLLPSLANLLKDRRDLQSLTLHSYFHPHFLTHPHYLLHYNFPTVLVQTLSSPKIQEVLRRLDVVVTLDHWKGFSEIYDDVLMVMITESLKAFRRLEKVRLVGMRGSWNLRALLRSLPTVTSLTLDEEPCDLALHELVPKEEGAESPVPESLRLLTLEHGGHFAAAKHPVAEGWLPALRQVLRAAPRMHVRVDRSACTAARRLDKVVILPHPVDKHCQDCPGKAAEKIGFDMVFIEDFFSSSQ